MGGNSMGIKINDVVKISLTDIYNIVFTIYNSLLDTSIKELDSHYYMIIII